MTSSARSRPAGKDSLIKVWFKFVPREGWLPFDTEGLWAEPVEDDTARLRNVPFLANGVAEGDIWRFVTLEDGRHFATQRVEGSGNCTIRVLPRPEGPLGPSAQRVSEKFKQFGIGGEVYSRELPLVALTVPAGTDTVLIKELLERGTHDGWWFFETGCVTQEWNAAWE
jgi:hypothetical protein